jgi:GNAT superfamily N-acetyltransferase
MTRIELDDLVSWADREGWNPGSHDADVFWRTDPEAFIAADFEEEMIGGGAITSYSGDFGFMGFFIVRPEFRGRGFGHTLWHARRERLLARLSPGASIGLDGVFEMQDYYAKGGFVFSHRNLRFRAEIPADFAPLQNPFPEIVPLDAIPFDQVLEYDRSCFPASRTDFLKAWISRPDALALGYVKGDTCRGVGVVRRCGPGCKIGPLFADDGEVAETLYAHLTLHAAGGPVFIDIPENNAPAMALTRRHAMTDVFGCARMYLGPVPRVAHHRVFGITTFELG